MTGMKKNIQYFNRVLWAILWSLTVIIVIFLLFLAFIQRVEVAKIHLDSQVSFTLQALEQQIEIQLPMPYLDVNTSDIKKRLEQHPLVYSAQVKKTFKGELFISTTRSSPLVAILAQVNGKNVPAYFDVTGKCVQVGIGGGIVDTPIVSGISIISPRIGIYLPRWMYKFLEDLQKIKKENVALFHQISELRIVSNENNYKTLKIWFVNYEQNYMVDMDITIESLERLWFFADRVSREKFAQEFESFDLRQGVIIGKRKKENDKRI